MDTIDVKYDLRDGNHEIVLILNGEEVLGTFDCFFFIHSILTKFSVCELLTCTCGVAGCAGVFFGTRVKVRKNTVEWRDIDSGLPKSFYSFDKQDYLVAIKKTKSLFYSNIIGVECEDPYSLCSFDSYKEFESCLKRGQEWQLKKAKSQYYYLIPYFKTGK